MGLIGALSIASLVTASATHFVFIKPMLSKLVAEKPGSFGANNKITTVVVSFVLAAVTFPVMMYILLSSSAGKVFYNHMEESFGQE
jgi:hypothetical protein